MLFAHAWSQVRNDDDCAASIHGAPTPFSEHGRIPATNCNAQIYAFEPIPENYSVLVRNLYNTSSDSVKAGTCPKPVALRVALGAEQGEEEFHFFEDNPGESTRWARIVCRLQVVGCSRFRISLKATASLRRIVNLSQRVGRNLSQRVGSTI